MTMAETPVEPLHRRLGVTDDELVAIRERLGGRDPNDLELAMFSVMWSEHCSYKSSQAAAADAAHGRRGRGRRAGRERRGHLASATAWRSRSRSSRTTTPARSSRTRARRPAWAASCATSSRWARGRSPSSTRSGSAIRRDPRTRHLVDGVVRGVGGYGNCVGVPTVGGELVFDPSYQGNPLVNVMAIGLHGGAAPDAGRGARARQPGASCSARPPGATGSAARRVLAAATFTDGRPVQAARPSRSATRSPRSCSSRRAWSSSSGAWWRASRTWAPAGSPAPRPRRPTGPGTGILVDLDAIPRREPGMEPFEVMISESRRSGCARRSGRTAGTTSARSASAGACRSRSSAGSRPTATSPSSPAARRSDDRCRGCPRPARP